MRKTGKQKKTKIRSEKSGPGPGMTGEIERLIQEHHLYFCLECGKCSSICPMLEFYGEYAYERSPRGIVELLCLDPENINQEALWYCLTCRECTFFCPSGVDFQGFMTSLRERLLEYGHDQYAYFCPTCKSYLMPKKEIENFQKRLAGGKIGDLLLVCPKCKKNVYAETLYRVAPLPRRALTRS